MSWFIKVRNMVYGPYSKDRMIRFAAEGRLSAKTMVSDNRDQGFMLASEDSTLEDVLQNNDNPNSDDTKTAHGKHNSYRQFVLHTRLSPNMEMEFGSLLRQFGEPIEPIPGVWVLHGDTSSAHLRNVLSRELTVDDKLLIFEILPNQSAWFNIGEIEDRQFRTFLGR